MGQRHNPPSFRGLPDEVLVYLDLAMEAGLDFDRLAAAVDRGDKFLSPATACTRAELWFWQRGLLWNYPKLTERQEAAWENVWSALETWLDENIGAPDEPHGNAEIATILGDFHASGDADDEVGNEHWGDGAARFDGAFEEDELRSAGYEGDAAELNWIDREALLDCQGAILRWDSDGFRGASVYSTKKALDRAWNEITTHYALPPPTVVMSNTDEDGVLLVVDGEGAADWARNDQTIYGARWEIDGTVGVAIVPNEPDLADRLRAEGYLIDDSEWSPPDEDTE